MTTDDVVLLVEQAREARSTEEAVAALVAAVAALVAVVRDPFQEHLRQSAESGFVVTGGRGGRSTQKGA